MALTLPEAIDKIEQLDAKIKTFEAEAKKKADADAEAKKAEADAEAKKAEAKKAEAEGKEKMAEAKKMMKAAYDEEDPEKVRERIAEAYKKMGGEAKKAESESEDDKEEDEEKEAMKAELKKPRLQILTASYKGRVDEKTLEVFTAQWNKMTFTQLDAEIQKVKPFIAKTISTNTATAVPLGMGTTLPVSYVAKKEEFNASMKEMSVSKLFGGHD